MTTTQVSGLILSSVNKFAVEAVNRGMINTESDMASFIDAAANYFNIPGEVVAEIVYKIAEKAK